MGKHIKIWLKDKEAQHKTKQNKNFPEDKKTQSRYCDDILS